MRLAQARQFPAFPCGIHCLAGTIPDMSEAPEPPVSHQGVGDLIGNRYEIVRAIGRGGMGVVYLAQDTKLNRYIAIKRLLISSKNRTNEQRRFLREAQTIASLGHIHIVNIYDIGQDEFGYYITMEYIGGPTLGDSSENVSPPSSVTLGDYVEKAGTLELKPAVALMVKICGAVEYAHHQSIIHRDIKPNNVLLTDHHEPKLVDFGLARSVSNAQTEAITLEGQFVGTPEYVAPEQLATNEVDGRADIYALGGLLWFMLTGKIPRYFRESLVPEELRPALVKALAHKPGERYQTVQELADGLNAVVHAEPALETAIEAEGADPRQSGYWYRGSEHQSSDGQI
jgi:serine/threonine-protein kinase